MTEQQLPAGASGLPVDVSAPPLGAARVGARRRIGQRIAQRIQGDGRWLIAAIVAAGLFAAAWWLLHQPLFFGTLIVIDTPGYFEHAQRILDGLVPYRDFPLEYPPFSLPVFLLPSLVVGRGADLDTYIGVFEQLMLVLGAAATVFMVLALRSLGTSNWRLALAVAVAGLSPVLVGNVILQHYDLWPAALMALAVWLVVAGHERLGSGALALGVMAKIYPVVAVPLVVAYVWRRKTRRDALICTAVLLGVMALVLLPFVVLAPEGVWRTLQEQIVRPLQIESLGAAALIVVRQAAGLTLTVETSYGSQNLVGSSAGVAAVLQSAVQVLTLVGLWAWFARGPADRERFVLAVAAALTAYVAFGKVLSPQYMIWLIPIVPLVGGRRGVSATAVFVVALLLTRSYFPGHYFDLPDHLDPGVASVVLLRDLTLIGLLGVLLVPVAAMTARARTAFPALSRPLPIAEYLPGPGATLALVLIAAVLLRFLWLNLPAGSLIFDEAYYVNAARVMLGWQLPPDAPYAGAVPFIDPNAEHPPLGKALIAGSMLLFGDNGLGWRLPSLIAAVVALLALYGIVRAAGGKPWTAVLATALYSLDILSFIHGRIGVLDMMMVAFMLTGAWLWLTRRWVLAGAALALATLIKLPGGYGLIAALVWQAIGLWQASREGRRIGWPELRPTVGLVGVYAGVFLIGLWLLDLRFTQFSSPFAHISSMLSYGLALQQTYNPSGITSAPWEWLVNAGQFDYFKVAVNSLVNGEVVGSRATVEFRALLNPVLLGLAPLAVIYAAWLAWRRGHQLALWSLVWIGATYLPYVFLSIFANRITYFYYVLPVVPALVVAITAFLVQARIPRFVVWGFVFAVLIAFLAYFPFREIPTG